MAIASAVVSLSGILTGVDQALQPYNGVLVLLTAVVAVIAGGIGSLSGAFVMAMALTVLQSIALVLMPGPLEHRGGLPGLHRVHPAPAGRSVPRQVQPSGVMEPACRSC